MTQRSKKIKTFTRSGEYERDDNGIGVRPRPRRRTVNPYGTPSYMTYGFGQMVSGTRGVYEVSCTA